MGGQDIFTDGVESTSSSKDVMYNTELKECMTVEILSVYI